MISLQSLFYLPLNTSTITTREKKKHQIKMYDLKKVKLHIFLDTKNLGFSLLDFNSGTCMNLFHGLRFIKTCPIAYMVVPSK